MSKSLGELENYLFRLAYFTTKEAKALVNKGYQVPLHLYLRYKLGAYPDKPHEFQKPDWGVLLLKVRREIEKLSVFNDIVRKVSRAHETNKDQALIFLSRFLDRIIVDVFENRLAKDKGFRYEVTTRQLKRYVGIFNKELEIGPNYRASVDLLGLTVASDQIELDANLVLHSPTDLDLEYEAPIELSSRKPSCPTAVLDFKQAKDLKSFLHELELIITTLMLFRVGTVHYTRYRWFTEKTIVGENIQEINQQVFKSIPSYEIEATQGKKLKQFWKYIKPIIEKKRLVEHDEISPSAIAFQRYKDAILQNWTCERRIADAIMGLEALYLAGDGEKSYRLRVRVSKIMASLKYDVKQVLEDVKYAYKIRSRFVHGGRIKETKSEDLLNRILEYLRTSIITFISIPCDKDRFNKMIDNAMLTETSNDELQRLLRDTKTLALKD